MFRALATMFSPPAFKQEAGQLYVAITARSRDPKFYTDYGVEDTLDGRFDMLTVELFLVIDRLKKEPSEDAQELIRALSESFFSDMDRSLREMGSSDTGIGKRIKKMSQAFYGRMVAYQTAGQDKMLMQEMLLRNLYRGDEAKTSHAARMADYMHQCQTEFAKQTCAPLFKGSYFD